MSVWANFFIDIRCSLIRDSIGPVQVADSGFAQTMMQLTAMRKLPTALTSTTAHRKLGMQFPNVLNEQRRLS